MPSPLDRPFIVVAAYWPPFTIEAKIERQEKVSQSPNRSNIGNNRLQSEDPYGSGLNGAICSNGKGEECPSDEVLDSM